MDRLKAVIGPAAAQPGVQLDLGADGFRINL
jgi:hypothetical protein